MDDARALARRIVDEGYAGYEQMPRLLWSEDDNLANVDFYDPAVIAAMTEEMSE